MNKMRRIFDGQVEYWTRKNQDFFGVTARDWDSLSRDEAQNYLFEDSSEFWNNDNPCELMKLILDGTLCRDVDKMVPKSIMLTQNDISECIDIRGIFHVKKGVEVRLIAAIPTPNTTLSWTINKTKYTPRITAYRDYSIVARKGNIVSQGKDWDFDITTNQFNIKAKPSKKHPDEFIPYDELSGRSIALLEAILGKKLNRNNFRKALRSLPEFSENSVFNYGFNHLDVFFNLVRYGKRFASPLKNVPLGINLLFLKQVDDLFDVTNKLVISKSPIFSLENFRTVMYKSSYNFPFAFEDTSCFFDAFKTTTNKAAGRHRLLLDNISVHDGMLFINKDGKEYNMFEAINNQDLQQSSISVISSSDFCWNNDPKRIMMTAKLSTQSIPTMGQTDPFTNRTPARVVFADIKGDVYADSIVISESFAEKLKSYEIIHAELKKKHPEYERISEKMVNGDYSLNYHDLTVLLPGTNEIILDNYENAKVIRCDQVSDTLKKFFIKVDVPFRIGDKITNLHGSKGVVSKILPDSEMPYLKNDIGDFKAGPFEIVISGFSVLRRGSLGQLFEAWANASGVEVEHGEDFIVKMVEKYGSEMREFSKKSVVVYEGVESIKPCGVIDMIRLYHHASTKATLSYIKLNPNKMLKLGEMEKLNLAGCGLKDILSELSIRSTHKHQNALKHINDLMQTRILEDRLTPSLNFARVLRAMGLNMSIDRVDLTKMDDTEMSDFGKILQDVVGNDRIDLEDIFGSGDKDA